MVKKKNSTDRAFDDIKNIVGPRPISLASGVIGDSMHLSIGYLPTLEQMPKDSSPLIGCIELMALSRAVISSFSSPIVVILVSSVVLCISFVTA